MPQGWRKGYHRYRSFFLDIYRVYKNRTDIKMFLEILFSLVTISFFAAFALRPTALTITQLLEDIKSKEETVTIMDQKILDIASAHEVYDREPRIDLLNQTLPNFPSPEAFARQVEGLAQKSGANVNSLIMDDILLLGTEENAQQLPEGAAPSRVGELDFSLNVLGDFVTLSSFLKDLENLRRPLKIDQAIISIAQLEEGDTLTLSVTGRVPYFK